MRTPGHAFGRRIQKITKQSTTTECGSRRFAMSGTAIGVSWQVASLRDGSANGECGCRKDALACTYWVNAPCGNKHHITGLASHRYFGPNIVGTTVAPSSWLSQPDGGLTYLNNAFTQGGYDPNAPNGYIAATMAILAADYTYLAVPYSLEMVAYEGGPNLQSSDPATAALYLAFDTDPRMQAVYAAFLNASKSVGYLHLMNQFDDVQPPAPQFGLWGALYNLISPSSPKYNALLSFIKNNPCWWNNCTTSGTSPTTSVTPPPAPAGLAPAAIAATQVNLTWNSSSGAAGYNVFRNGTKVGNTSQTSYQDAPLAAASTYTYTASA